MNLAIREFSRLLGALFFGVALFHPQILPAQGLSLAANQATATISWPATNFYDLLQTNTDLSRTNGWGNVGSASQLTQLVGSDGVNSGGSWLSSNYYGSVFTTIQPAANVPRQFFRLKTPSIPLFCFGIFYDQLLEFSDAPTMIMNGFVHANGPIYTGPGSGASQNFNGPVTTASTISSPPNAGFSSWSGQATFNGNPPFVTNTPAFISPVGTNNPHVMIEISPAGEDPLSALGQSRLYNSAQVVLIITNSPLKGSPEVMLTFQTSNNGNLPGASGATPIILTNCTPGYLLSNSIVTLPFLSLTNTFTDQRESPSGIGINMFVTQIDVGAYGNWLSTNATVHSCNLNNGSGNFATILYVADQRNIGTSKLAVVRLLDAQELPPNTTKGGLNLGFSVATQNPLYVWGNYNITVDGTHFALTQGATTNGCTVPAALFSDAITMLSSQWVDALSGAAFKSRLDVSDNIVVNAAMLTGNVPSTGATASTFSGGFQNLTRMLENWGNVILTYNTSMVCLFTSQMATNQFQITGTYFYPPTRVWGFDPTFYDLTKLPPGTPVFTLP